MDKDKLTRNGVFALAVLGMLAVAAFSGNGITDQSNDHYTVERAHDRDDDSVWEQASDNIVQETREVDAFDTIEILGAAEVYITVGQEQSLAVKTSDNRLGDLITKVTDNTLYIDMERADNKVLWKETEVAITITVPTLGLINVKGAIDGHITGFSGEDFAIDVRGAADLSLEGTCDTLKLDLRGAGDIDGRGLECANVVVALRGAGDVNVYASQSIDAQLKGVGLIDVYGNPANVKKSSGGIGNIKIHN